MGIFTLGDGSSSSCLCQTGGSVRNELPDYFRNPVDLFKKEADVFGTPAHELVKAAGVAGNKGNFLNELFKYTN